MIWENKHKTLCSNVIQDPSEGLKGKKKKKKKVMLIFENIQNIVSFLKNSAPNEVFKAYESKYLYSENVKNFCFTSLETVINSFSLKSLANFLPFCYSTYHKIVITVKF